MPPTGEDDEAAREARAEELAEEVVEENPDPITRREALEQALEDEGLEDESPKVTPLDPPG